jgi:E-phenylitaconyl-CoA hydratase
MSVDFQKEGRLAIITLNRPDALNAFDPDQVDEFNRRMNEFDADDDLWVAIVTASGERAFCVGADIKTTLPKIQASTYRGDMPIPAICGGRRIWKPLIAAINGACLGGGLELALACDIRIASEKAIFGFPEVNLGLLPGWSGSQILPRVVPLGKALEMLMSGRPIDAQEAYRINLINKIVPGADLMTEARKFAEIMLKPAPLAARGVKQAVIQGLNTTFVDGLDIEHRMTKYLTSTQDFIEGRDAFIAKRKPEFKAK